MATQPQSTSWLSENGPKALELLFRAIVFHPSAPILDRRQCERRYQDASVGAGKLLGLPSEKLVGHTLDDFATPEIKPEIPERWQAFLEDGKQSGTIQLFARDGAPKDMEYTAKGNILPSRHLLLLRDAKEQIPSWVQDYALFLLDGVGLIVAWYGGAERIYQYKSEEVIDRDVSMLYPDEDAKKLKRAVDEGHFVEEGWHVKKDGTRFWANVITVALKNESGDLQGFARMVRDFSDRHARDEKLRHSRARIRPIPAESTIVGVISGEFEHISEANDTFLELVGYSRQDFLAGQLVWPDLYALRICWGWTNLPTRKDCVSELARRLKKS